MDKKQETTREEQCNDITVMGVGGYGRNTVESLLSMGVKGVDFVVCDTNERSLNSSSAPVKHLLPLNQTIWDRDESWKQIVFIVCGMGGMTGATYGPILAKEAKAHGLLTIGVVTLPFRFEGKETIKKALSGVQEMSKYTDSLLVFDNESLFELYGKMKIFEALTKVFATPIERIINFLNLPTHSCFDHADFKRTMRNGGLALFGVGEAEGNDRAIKATEQAFHSPFLHNIPLRMNRALVNVTISSEEAIDMEELSKIAALVSEHSGNSHPYLDVLTYDESLGNRLRITILAAGFELEQLLAFADRMQ
jgi:cell division protein FtsZ